ncbi:hypothetical protein [Halocynthiibacter sp.]|uniref:hypothetical protein n=1 Tax=Halocynthiibacter sp. TaxID=1979210 RepID=UPI003C5AD026
MTGPFTIRDFTRAHGAYIARFAAQSRKSLERLDVSPISETEKHLRFRLEFPEDPVIVDVWSKEDPAAEQAFNRELTCARLLQGSALTASLLGHSQEKCLMLRGDVQGTPLNSVLSQDNVVAMSSSLGSWFQRFHQKMPQKEADMTWFSYLKNYPGLFEPEEYEREKAFLERLKIGAVSIARNDRIRGFLVSDRKTICAPGFQRAGYKPIGWDLLLATRDLVRQFPGQTDDIIAALLAGWGAKVPGLNPEDFIRLAKLFCVATVFRAYTPSAPLLRRYADAFNASREKGQGKITTVLSVPYKSDLQQDVQPQDVEAFRRHLQLVTTERGDMDRQITEDEIRNTDNPVPVLAAIGEYPKAWGNYAAIF